MATATKVRPVTARQLAPARAPTRPPIPSFRFNLCGFNSLTIVSDEGPRYERDNRSASPRPLRDENDGGRRRSASPGGNNDR
jgi:hypothetical protein